MHMIEFFLQQDLALYRLLVKAFAETKGLQFFIKWFAFRVLRVI